MIISLWHTTHVCVARDRSPKSILKPSSPHFIKAPSGDDSYSTWPVHEGKTSSNSSRALQNLGNTCFINCTLQCLAHTLPLVRMVLGHRCQQQGWCGLESNKLCLTSMLKWLFNRLLYSTQTHEWAPYDFNQHLKVYAPKLKQGSQNDAHEYLRCVLEAIAKSATADTDTYVSYFVIQILHSC